MAIWASAGACGTGLTGVDTHIYMDDRSFWTDSIQKVERQIKRWQAWSTVMGLLESPQKTKVVARGQRQREQEETGREGELRSRHWPTARAVNSQGA